jgi:hypothetical protein
MDWQPIQVRKKPVIIVASIAYRIFAGPVLCRYTKWLETSATYPRDLFAAIARLKLSPQRLRPLAKYYV